MTHSQSHAGFGLQGWENRNNSQGSSPARASLMSSPGARPSWGRTMSLSDRAIGQPRGRLQGLNFPTLNNSMKIASSEAVLNAPDNASMASVDGESGQGLFGDFKMLDLDLGGGDGSLDFIDYGDGAQADVQDGHEDDKETADAASGHETDEEYKAEPDDNDEGDDHLKAAPTGFLPTKGTKARLAVSVTKEAELSRDERNK